MKNYYAEQIADPYEEERRISAALFADVNSTLWTEECAEWKKAGDGSRHIVLVTNFAEKVSVGDGDHCPVFIFSWQNTFKF